MIDTTRKNKNIGTRLIYFAHASFDHIWLWDPKSIHLDWGYQFDPAPKILAMD